MVTEIDNVKQDICLSSPHSPNVCAESLNGPCEAALPRIRESRSLNDLGASVPQTREGSLIQANGQSNDNINASQEYFLVEQDDCDTFSEESSRDSGSDIPSEVFQFGNKNYVVINLKSKLGSNHLKSKSLNWQTHTHVKIGQYRITIIPTLNDDGSPRQNEIIPGATPTLCDSRCTQTCAAYFESKVRSVESEVVKSAIQESMPYKGVGHGLSGRLPRHHQEKILCEGPETSCCHQRSPVQGMSSPVVSATDLAADRPRTAPARPPPPKTNRIKQPYVETVGTLTPPRETSSPKLSEKHCECCRRSSEPRLSGPGQQWPPSVLTAATKRRVPGAVAATGEQTISRANDTSVQKCLLSRSSPDGNSKLNRFHHRESSEDSYMDMSGHVSAYFSMLFQPLPTCILKEARNLPFYQKELSVDERKRKILFRDVENEFRTQDGKCFLWRSDDYRLILSVMYNTKLHHITLFYRESKMWIEGTDISAQSVVGLLGACKGEALPLVQTTETVSKVATNRPPLPPRPRSFCPKLDPIKFLDPLMKSDVISQKPTLSPRMNRGGYKFTAWNSDTTINSSSGSSDHRYEMPRREVACI